MKKFLAALLSLSVLISLSACGSAKESNESSGRIVVNMMYMNELSEFEKLVETTYPDIDLQIEINMEATIDGEGERRLRNGHGMDIVTTSMPSGEVREYVLDLSAEPFTDKYQSGIVQSTMIDGRSCFIPTPGQYYGYIFNKTIMEENGLEFPEKASDIPKLLEKAAGLGVGIGEDGSLFGINSAWLTISSYFLGIQIPDFLGVSDGIIWSRDMQEKKSSFSEKMQHCLDLDSIMVEKGYFNLSGLAMNGNEVPVEKRMLDGTLLVTYSNTSLFNRLSELTDKYEYEMRPFLSENGNQPWIIAQPDSYLAINSALSDPGNADKLDACERIFDLLSTVEGQSAFIKDTSAEHSYLAEPVPYSDRIPEGIEDCTKGGFIYNIRIPSNVTRYFGNRMVAVLRGDTDISTALAQVDDYYINGDENIEYDQTLIGVVAEDLLYENFNTRMEETAIGNLVSDAVREATGAEMAFVNGGAIRGSLYKGNVFGSDLDVVCPYDNLLVVLEVDAETIRQMLSNGISGFVQDNGIPAGRFLNVSGLCYSFRKPAEDGSTELLEVTLPDGSPLDENGKYTIAVTSYMAGANGYFNNNGDGFTMLNVYSDEAPIAENVTLVLETDYTYAEALKQYFEEHNKEAITANIEGRIKVIG